MESDGFCGSDCQRYVDAAPGSCTIEVHAYRDMGEVVVGSGIVKTVTFNDPEQTELDVAFP